MEGRRGISVIGIDRQHEFKLARRATYLKIKLDRILENLRILKSRCSEHTDVIAVVKANAYGHGSVHVAKCLEAHGYSHFAVATAQEGEELRKGGIQGYIQVFGSPAPEEIPTLYQNRLTPTVAELDFLAAWTQYVRKHGENNHKDQTSHPRWVVIKIDTGMSRNGCFPADLPKLVQVCNNNGILIHSMMTHFAQAWDDEQLTKKQYELFLQTVEPYRGTGIKFHVANSGGTLNQIGTELDFIRPGIAMYGQAQDPSDRNVRLARSVGLKPAIEWFAKPSLVKDLEANSAVGYDQTYRCSGPETVAVIPLGYADGYQRQNYQKGYVTTQNGTKCPVVGRVSMDAITVQLPEAAKDARYFCVMSADYSDVNSCYAIAQNTGTIQYEVCTNLHVRLPRLYELAGEIITS